MKFYDRETEMEELESARKISEAHKVLMVITGRRRVGKTELIHRFFSGRDGKGVYFFVNPKKTGSELFSEFSSMLSSGLALPEYVKPDTWGSFFRALFEASRKRHMVVAIDEFQRFLDIEPSVIFELQKEWDAARESRLLLIISGSSIGMMRKIFTEQKAPLFKRAHNIMTVAPFDFETVCVILEDFGVKDAEEQVTIYSIYGGIPMYYLLIGDYKLTDAKSSIERLLLRDLAPLRNEVSEILIEEFGKEVPTYYAIMTAIAMGKGTAKEIADYAGIKETSLAPYIDNLAKVLGVVSREVPVTENKPEKSKKGRYILKDNFFRFWFRYIHRNMSSYEIRNYGAIREKMDADISSFVGAGFEQLCRESLVKLNKVGKLPFFFERMGRQWGKFKGETGKNTYEIDAVAISDRTRQILFAECKWQDKVDAARILSELKEKAKYVDWNLGKRKEHYAIFAKSFGEKIEEPGVLLFDLAELKKVFRGPTK